MSNVHFFSQRPREDIPALIRSSDVCLVLLKKAEAFKKVIPTKMLEYMACGKAVVFGVDGQSRRMLEDAGAGIFVEPEDPEALVAAIMRLRGNADLRRTLGDNGRRYVVENLSREQTAGRYSAILEDLVANWKGHLSAGRGSESKDHLRP